MKFKSQNVDFITIKYYICRSITYVSLARHFIEGNKRFITFVII